MRTVLRNAVTATLAAAALAVGNPAALAATNYTLTTAADAFTGHSVTVRWAPCTVINGVRRTHVITYRVDPAGVSSRVTVAKNGIARLAAASGLHFRYLGTTSYIPHNSQFGGGLHYNALQQRKRTGAELVIAWATPKQTNMFSTGEDGVGTISWRSSNTSQTRILEAAVLMKRGVHLRSGFTAGGSVGALLLHELGHASGLQHVLAPAQRGEIMYPVLGSYSPGGYTIGDVAGLRRVGAPAGCMTTRALSPLGTS